MTAIHGFELIRDEELTELKSKARLYRHIRTGAELISIVNDDENKSFGITFRTPPTDSTGIAHILEHSVLCGSRKYPLKEPFIELVKGSLNTFLNAMTGSAETYYPVASLNERDFYNLVDVYLDAVFHPRLSPETLHQEGWHYEVTEKDQPLVYKGVVFNEMKGAYQSPDTVLYDQAERSLFPGHVYGVSSGGDPKSIPDLTFEMLDTFHKRYYHPSNARIWFWGDDNADERLRLLDSYLSEFDARPVDGEVPLARAFADPVRLNVPFAVGDESAAKGMLALSWVLTDKISFEFDLAMEMLKHILIGTPASPLRKSLVDSGMVEYVGGGVSELRQRSLRIGLKGMAVENAAAVEKLVFETLSELASNGIDPEAVEAAVNTTEFGLRELNTGGFPRGLMMMFYSLSTWIFGGDPYEPLRFEGPLSAIKSGIAAGSYFEDMIRRLLIENKHRSIVVYTPDPALAESETAEERTRLESIRQAMSEADIDNAIAETRHLLARQQTPDSEEALATLPRLTLADLDPKIKTTPTDRPTGVGCDTYFHDLFTNGIIYLDLGFDLTVVPQELMPYIPLFGRSLLQMGTKTEDFVQLTQRIGRKTGGVRTENPVSSVYYSADAVARLFLRSKATPAQAVDLVAILQDVILTGRTDNQDRFKQMVMEEKVRLEASLSSAGHGFAARRLAARFTQAGWIGEQTGGIDYLGFIRRLAETVTQDWPSVQNALDRLRKLVFTRGGLIVNVTVDHEAYDRFEPLLADLVGSLPHTVVDRAGWQPPVYSRKPEAFAIPGQVNFVAKMANLRDFGYDVSGSALVVNNLLRTTWLWEKVRVEGGAYGGFCNFDHITGLFGFMSYRDPNLLNTLDIFDKTGDFLQNLSLSDAEIVRNIIGTVSDLDAYQLPDAKGMAAMWRIILGETDERRQNRRDQVLSTTLQDLRAFGEVLSAAVASGEVCVVGSNEAVDAANSVRPGMLSVTKVL